MSANCPKCGEPIAFDHAPTETIEALTQQAVEVLRTSDFCAEESRDYFDCKNCGVALSALFRIEARVTFDVCATRLAPTSADEKYLAWQQGRATL